MQKTITQLPEMYLVGMKIRTSYQNELNLFSGKIFPTIQQYFQKKLFERIANRKKPGTTFCAYTDYENDHTGSYTYFVGEEVASFASSIPENLETLAIEPQTYVKFTTGPGPMPTVVIHAWQKIWRMPPKDLGGRRNYKTDFEVYDERALDQQNAVLDLYVGTAS